MAPMASALPRPRQVTVAGWMIMAGSAAVVLTVFQQIAGLHSIDTRDAVGRALAEPPFDSLGMSVDDVLGIMRVLSMASAACATATAALGWYVLRRSRPARTAATVLALPLFVSGIGSGIGTGGIFSTAVALAVLVLWLDPTRAWFDGRWKPEPAENRTMPVRTPAEPPAASPERSRTAPEQQPPPYAGWPPPQASPTQPPATWSPPQGSWLPPVAQLPVPRATTRRPTAVVATVVLTWVCSVLLGGLFVIGAVQLIASPEALMDEVTRQSPELLQDDAVTIDLLRGTLAVMTGMVVLWALATCTLALFLLRRASWARLLLLVSTGAAGLGLLVGSLLIPVLVVPLAGAVATFALLLRRDVSAWFRG
jgi:hypothetical protein